MAGRTDPEMSPGPRRRVLSFGDAAYLIRVRDEDPSRLAEAIRARPPSGIVDVVAGEESVLVVADPAVCDMEALEIVLGRYDSAPTLSERPEPIAVPVVYDGADLDEVAERVGMSPKEVAAVHAAATYTVSYLGFAPGFAYLEGLDQALWIERRDTPRVSVPRGSVAIANHRSCIYPSPGPGGWHLLGRTDLTLFNPACPNPALFSPGDRVKFCPIEPA